MTVAAGTRRERPFHRPALFKTLRQAREAVTGDAKRMSGAITRPSWRKNADSPLLSATAHIETKAIDRHLKLETSLLRRPACALIEASKSIIPA
jgi:hypothetical protein